MAYKTSKRPDGIDQLIVDAMADLSDLKLDVLSGKIGPEAIANSIGFIGETIAMIADARRELEASKAQAIEQLNSLANEDVHRRHGCQYAEIGYEDLQEVIDTLRGKPKEVIKWSRISAD